MKFRKKKWPGNIMALGASACCDRCRATSDPQGSSEGEAVLSHPDPMQVTIYALGKVAGISSDRLSDNRVRSRHSTEWWVRHGLVLRRCRQKKKIVFFFFLKVSGLRLVPLAGRPTRIR